jgi:hypothetical protein
MPVIQRADLSLITRMDLNALVSEVSLSGQRQPAGDDGHRLGRYTVPASINQRTPIKLAVFLRLVAWY